MILYLKTGKTSKETAINFKVKFTNVNIIIPDKWDWDLISSYLKGLNPILKLSQNGECF